MESQSVELRAEGLSLLHPQEDGTSRGLLPFTATFRPGRLHLVEGESGSGKTTLLSLLGLLEAPGEGRVLLSGEVLSSPSSKERDLRKGRAHFSCCLRELDYLPSLTLRENLRLAGGDLAKGERVLSDLGLGERLGERAALLSTGELQRLSLALAIVSPAPVLLLDEPTANLDVGRRAAALRWIEREAATRVVVLAAHDYLPAEGGPRPHRILLEDGRAVLQEEGEEIPVPTSEEGESLPPSLTGKEALSLAFRRRKGLGKAVAAGLFSLILSFLSTSVLSLSLPDASLYYRSLLEGAGEEAALVTYPEGGNEAMKANSWYDLDLDSFQVGDGTTTDSFALVDEDGIFDFGLDCPLKADEIGFPESMLEEMGDPETVTLFHLPYKAVALPYEPGTAMKDRGFITKAGVLRLLEEAAVSEWQFSFRAVGLANSICQMNPNIEPEGGYHYPFVMSRALAGGIDLPERSFAIVLSEDNPFAPEPLVGQDIPLASKSQSTNQLLPDLPEEIESLAFAKVIRLPAEELPFNANFGHGLVYSDDVFESLLEDMEERPLGWTGNRFVPADRIGPFFFDGNVSNGHADYDGLKLLGQNASYFFGKYIEIARLFFLLAGLFLLALLGTALAHGSLLVRQNVRKDELSLELRGMPLLKRKAPGLIRFALLLGIPALLGALLSPLGAWGGGIAYTMLEPRPTLDPAFVGPSWGASFLAIGIALFALGTVALLALYLPSRKSLSARLRMRREGEE